MSRPKWWQKPVLNTAEELHKHRKVTWLELFFDLFFVVTIGQLAHHLSSHLSWHALLDYTLHFIPVWWVWIGYTLYNERFETSGVENRFFAFLIMIPTAGLAIYGHGGIEHEYTGYAISYAIARAIITFLWIWGCYHNKRAWRIGVRYAIGFTTSIILVVSSVFVDAPYKYFMFGAALLIDLGTPLTTIKLTEHLPKFSTSKLPERFGLFTIIVLGESIIGVVGAVANDADITSRIIFSSILGIAISFSMWWIYFYYVGRRPFGEKTFMTFLWSYLHMPLVMAIAMSGACLSNVINFSNESYLDPTQRILMAFSILAVMVFVSLIELTLRRDKNEPTKLLKSTVLKIVTAVLIMVVGILGTTFSTIELLSVILALMVINMIYGFLTWYGHDLENIESA